MPPDQTGTGHKRFIRGRWPHLSFDLTSPRLGGLIVMVGGLTYEAAVTFYLVLANVIGSDSAGYVALAWTFDLVEIFVMLSFAVGLVSLYALLRRRLSSGSWVWPRSF